MSAERRYRIQEVLGRGSFGVVYRADLLAAGGFAKPVAIKVLKASDHPQEEIEQRLRDEARILGLLRHPNVVRVDGLARLGDGWAVVMEYIDGVDGGELIRAGDVPVRAALEIAEEVASALHAAWAVPSEITGEPLRIIHRDMKPSNVRVTSHGEVKVLDFGAARADFHGRESSTQAWRFGTPRYMSPERHDGVEGPEGDIYAIGLILAQLLGARQDAEPPTHPDRHARFLEDLRQQITTSLAVRHPEIPPVRRDAIVGMVEHMLAFEPRDRPDARTAQQELRGMSSELIGQGLRAWAEVAVPEVGGRLAPFTSDERCGLVVMEGGPLPGISSSRGPDETLAVEIEDADASPSLGPAPSSWRRAVGGLAIALLLVAAISFALLPAAVVQQPGRPEAAGAPASPAAAGVGPGTSGGAELVAAPAEMPPVVEPMPVSEVIAATTPPTTAERAGRRGAGSRAATSTRDRDAAETTDAEQRATPAPVVSAAPQAHVELAGGAAELRLAAGDQRLPPGNVPPGTYTIEVRFEGAAEFVPAGRVTLGAEERVRVVCNANLLRCRKESS